MLGRLLINLESIMIIITEIQTVLNDRPLTDVSLDPVDEELHVLYSRANLLNRSRIISLPRE